MIFIAQDQATFVKKAAQVIAETTAEAIEKNKRASWALSGGSTPKPVYEALAGSYFGERIDWSKLQICWADERCVPPGDAESNFKLVNDLLLSKRPIPKPNIHRMLGETENVQEAAKAYDQELKMLFRYERPFPKFDLMLLGVGDDGHTASLFPGTSALEENEKWVVGHRVEKLSANRITLTFPVINNARRILVLCSGEKKATVLRDVFWLEAPRTRYPIQKVKAETGELIWLLDRPAASKLTADAQKEAKYI